MSKAILKGETNRATSADVSVADPNATVALTGEHGCESTCPSNQQPADAREEEIAHRKWETAGFPAGDGFDFWLEAEREVKANQPASTTAPE